jgi:hypothetical protein
MTSNKNQKKNPQSQEGLGDTIAYLTSLLQLDKLVKEVTSAMGVEDCGCDRRKEKLNEMFPYKKDEDKKQQ